MTSERWQQIKSVLAEALEELPANRSACLDRSCAGDEDLRREVELWLGRERELSPRFLNETALPRAAARALTAGSIAWVGRRIGAYKTIELVGVGGMGEVYRALRADDQYRKEVALKVVRAGQDSSVILARFRHERQILASLEHPNIARLLDGGTTEEGTPYLVMELIEGQPIGQYCDSRKLSISERLALFTQVCAAVQYAHQRLIIHRDIKPSNILVTPEGVPKLLDFGIAKVLGTDLQSQSAETLTVFRALTPGYASPEQIKGDPVTTASDVYSLGVVLYELLTSRSPYSATSGAPQEFLRQICDLEPEKPSVAVTDKRSPDANAAQLTVADVSAARNTSPLKLRKQLQRDLDNIVLMALRKEPLRRYSSVEQFAEDIRRYLAILPVAARRDTPRYRASKFVARHKAGVAAVAAVALTLVIGLVITVQQARIAQRSFNDVRSLANSLIFDVHDSIKDLPGSTPARKIIVDRALQYLNVLARESNGDMGLQRELAAAYERVGAVQGDYTENNLGDSQGSLASYQKALEIRKQIDAGSRDWNDHLALAQNYRLVGHQQWANGDLHGAREHIDRAIAISVNLNSAQPENPKVLSELGIDYGASARLGYPEDRSAHQKIIEDYRRALTADETLLKIKPDDVTALRAYALELGGVGFFLESSDPLAGLASFEKALDIDRKVSQISGEPRDQRRVAIDYGSIGSVYEDVGDYTHAADYGMKDLAIFQELTRADPKNALLRRGLAIAYNNTAAASVREGKIELALEYSNKSAEMMRALVASEPQKAYQQGKFAGTLVTRGTILIAANRPEGAIADFESARSLYESRNMEGTTYKRTNVAACDVKIGEAAAQMKNEQAAADSYRRALMIVEPLISMENADLDVLYVAADAYSGLGDISMRKAQRKGQTADRQRSNWAEARSWYQLSLNIWHRFEHPNHTAPNSFQVGDPATAKKKLEAAENALASLH
jgi:eukaryotic-like serine/threonine-protein kinase